MSKNALRSNKFHPFIISFLHVNGIYICIYLLTARMVAYRFLGYVLLLLRRCTRIYVQQYCTVNLLRSNKFHQFIISLLQVIRDIRMYIPPHSSPYGVLFPWVRTGTAAAVYSYIRTAVLYCFFVSAIETVIVVACHVLFVTTVWISENELRESNIIIMMLISAHVLVVLYS